MVLVGTYCTVDTEVDCAVDSRRDIITFVLQYSNESGKQNIHTVLYSVMNSYFFCYSNRATVLLGGRRKEMPSASPLRLSSYYSYSTTVVECSSLEYSTVIMHRLDTVICSEYCTLYSMYCMWSLLELFCSSTKKPERIFNSSHRSVL